MKPFVALSPDLGASEVRAFRTRDDRRTLAAVKGLVPPFGPEVVAELVGLAYAFPSTLDHPLGAEIRARAKGLLERQVPNARRYTGAFKGVPAHATSELDERVRRLPAALAVPVAEAIAFHRWAAISVPFERDPAFRAAVLEVVVANAKRERARSLSLGEVYTFWRGGGGSATVTDLREVPEALAAELTRLRRRYAFTGLSFHGGSLTELPKTLGRARPWLRELCLAYNPFTRLPEVLFQLTNLEVLDLTGTAIRTFPDRLAKLTKLRELDLSDVRGLTTVPAAVCALPRLEVLRVGKGLRVLPPALGRLRALRELDLRGSNVTQLPQELSALPGLRRVDARLTRLGAEKARSALPPRCVVVT